MPNEPSGMSKEFDLFWSARALSMLLAAKELVRIAVKDLAHFGARAEEASMAAVHAMDVLDRAYRETTRRTVVNEEPSSVRGSE